MHWSLRHGTLDFSGVPIVMGVLNVTPDSFSDGGEFVDAAAAVRRAAEMVAQGAGMIDIGAESTRPGAPDITPRIQIERLQSILPAVRRAHPSVPISIDTRSAAVAEKAIEWGADVINDVSALRDDPGLAELAAGTGTPVILMHRRGTSRTMQTDLVEQSYGDVAAEVAGFLVERAEAAERSRIARQNIAIDPGIGFGKTVAHNLEILRRLNLLAALGYPVVIGVSRKRFIGAVLNEPDPKRRVLGSAVFAAIAVLGGGHVVRAHDVAETVTAVRVAQAIRGGG